MDGMKIRLFFWIFWTLGSSQAQDLHQDNPNIVFILTDDQGYNGVSWHNSKIITPNLHHLYNTGVHLSNYYVQPICSPTRSALMTGYYPYHLGRQRSVITSSMPTGLTLSKTLLPERLRDLGYRNHIVGKWHLGFCDWAYTPTRRGFDTFYGYYHGMEDYYSHIVDDGYDFRDNDRVATEANGTYSTYLLGDRAVEIIQEESTKSGPFFLYLPLQSIHSPFQVPAEYTALYPDESPFDAVYYGMLTAMDDVVGRVTDALNSSGLMDNTVVIFSSDNGSPFNERNHPLRGTKLTLWEGGTKSNGIINSPLIQNTPRNYTGLIHVTDWFNTVLSIAGGTADDNNDGFDQWNSIKTGSSGPRDSFVYNLDVEDGHVFGAIRVGKYKLFLGQETEHQSNIWLTDLEADPNETIDLSEENPDITNELKDLLTAQLSSLVPHDDPRSDDAGNPSNYGGVWSPGWCTATTTTTK